MKCSDCKHLLYDGFDFYCNFKYGWRKEIISNPDEETICNNYEEKDKK